MNTQKNVTPLLLAIYDRQHDKSALMMVPAGYDYDRMKMAAAQAMGTSPEMVYSDEQMRLEPSSYEAAAFSPDYYVCFVQA